MGTAVENFAYGTVSTGYDASATSVALSTGHGSRFPSTFPYSVVWWNATDYPNPADDTNKEIVTVTAKTGDTFTVTRGAEGTSASTKNTAGKTYVIMQAITKAMWQELQERALSQSFRGLTVQVHPDADLAASQVMFSADAIVMDDGEEVTDWENIEIDLTASGAGGLDTGSEAASTWYSIWAAYNGSTKIGLLHREKDYLLDEDGSAGGDGAHALRDATARTKLAQGFQVDTAGPVPFVDVQILKTGSPTGYFWFTIEGNNGGVPDGTPLATSNKMDVSRLTTTATWARILFREPVSLSALTQYHLVLQGDFTVNASNYMSWRADTTAGAYTRGSKAAYDGATWTADADDDFLFKIYIAENDTALTLPSGYTQSAKVGYCYNDASSNLKHFFARDRTVFCGYDDAWQIGALTNTTPGLVSLAAFLPPVPVSMSVMYHNGTAATIALGDLRCTDLSSTAGDERKGLTKATVGAGYVTPLTLNIDQFQGMMEEVNGGTANIYVGSFTW